MVIAAQSFAEVFFRFGVLLLINVNEAEAVVVESYVWLERDVLFKLFFGMVKIQASQIDESQIEVNEGQVGIRLRRLLEFRQRFVIFFAVQESFAHQQVILSGVLA